MLQLQETEDRKPPAATTWAAEFLLRVGESRDFLGLWINSSAIHEAKRRRATQVIKCSFPCGKWLHMIGSRASPRRELCRRERRHGQEAIEHLPEETVAHIQSAGCQAQRRASLELTTGVGSIYYAPSPREAKRKFEFIVEDKDRQLESLWRETSIGNVLLWEDITAEGY